MRPASLSLLLVAVVALIAASCSPQAEPTTTTTVTTTEAPTTTATAPPTTTTSTTTTTIPTGERTTLLVRPVAPFASGFPENPLLGDTPAYRGPATPTSLDGVLWGPLGDDALDAALIANGFVVVSAGYGMTQFHEAYSGVEESQRQPLFVTTDAAYHYWHLAFAKALRDTEEQVLLPILEQFATDFRAAAEAQAEELASVGGEVAAAADRVTALGELLTALLETEEGPFRPEVVDELALIEDHLVFETSPTTGAAVDYTLFVPRGHYTRTPEATRFFLAMSVLGQTAFTVAGDEPLLTALLVARVLESTPGLETKWRQIYEPTAFLVGLADDYTPFEAAAVAAEELADPATLGEPGRLAGIRADLLATRQVAIDPELASVRVMGARFVLDSYIIDQLVYPSVMSRLMGSPLDVAAAFGSDWAYEQLAAAGETSDPAYDPQLDAMRSFVTDREAVDWAGTVYDAWLYAIQPSWREHGAAYPDFMRTEAWAGKAHQSGLGSYTELKHDTVLYAKQSFAQGEGPPPPPAEPRHWVEPEPVIYARLAAVAELMKAGLGDRGLLADDVANVLDMLIEMYRRFERLAVDELAGSPISAEDNAWLETIGSRFELLWLMTTDAEKEGGMGDVGGFTEGPDGLAAVVVDIMSNPEEALEIATGLIDRIYVLVPNDEGTFQLARGGVYSYYEFTVPRGERMTDEEWRALLYEQRPDVVPDRPVWTESFVVTIE